MGCFQPHTYSRSAYLLEGFRGASRASTRCSCCRPTRRARRQIRASTPRGLAAEIAAPPAHYVASFEEAADAIAAELRRGDVCLTLGAGDVDRLLPLLRERLEAADSRERRRERPRGGDVVSDRTRLAVILGGRSPEHEVSVVSARSIIREADPERFEVVAVRDHARRRVADAG